jgi:hypothetical protein
MAGAAYIGGAALLDALVGAVLVALIVMLARGRANELLEFVFEPFRAEIVLLLGDPFLQPKMRLDHEFGHGFSLPGGFPQLRGISRYARRILGVPRCNSSMSRNPTIARHDGQTEDASS